MSRHRAGYGWTSIRVGNRYVAVLENAAGAWITTGEAQGWTRCRRCRVPFENAVVPEDPRLCERCAGILLVAVPRDPLSAGARHRRFTASLAVLHFAQKAIDADGPNPRWRTILRDAFASFASAGRISP